MDARQLASVCAISAGIAEVWAGPLTEAMRAFDITTPARQAMFLAQCTHETTGFTRFVENLNYDADGLANTWRGRFRGANGGPNAAALRLNRQPEKIANSVYANRLGNGPDESGDGWRFRGRGPAMITGRDMYEKCGAWLMVPLHMCPALLERVDYGAASAGWFWKHKDLSRFADALDIVGCTEAWNGGHIGLQDRTRRWVTAKVAMGVV